MRSDLNELTAADINDIRNLIGEYSLMLDEHELDADRFRELWARDAVFDLERDVYGFGTPLVGTDAIMERLFGYLAKDRGTWFIRHVISCQRLELIDGQPHAVSTMVSIRYDLTSGQDTAVVSRSGAYRDRFVHEDGRWRFAERRLTWDPPVDIAKAAANLAGAK